MSSLPLKYYLDEMGNDLSFFFLSFLLAFFNNLLNNLFNLVYQWLYYIRNIMMSKKNLTHWLTDDD